MNQLNYTDEPIELEVIKDFLPSPEELRKAEIRVISPPKKLLTIQCDEDIIEYFKSLGEDYTSRMNTVLRAYVNYHRHVH
jgi:uncharacterized protein (DUF4415 family)